MIDIYGRYSNVLRKRLDVKTSVFMYTNEKDSKRVIITNAADFTSTRITRSLYDPIRTSDNNISVSDAPEGFFTPKQEDIWALYEF